MKINILKTVFFYEFMVYWDLANLFCSISLWALLVLQFFTIQWGSHYPLLFLGCILISVLVRQCHKRLVNYYISSKITDEHMHYLNQFRNYEEFRKLIKPALKLQFNQILILNISTTTLYVLILLYLLNPLSQQCVEVTLLNIQVFSMCSQWIVYLLISERLFSFFNLLLIHEELNEMDQFDFSAIKAIYHEETAEIDSLQICIMAAIDDLVNQKKHTD